MVSTQLLKELPLFAGLTEDELKALSAICQEKEFKNGEIVFAEGSAANELFIVEAGAINVQLKVASYLDHLTVHTVIPKEIFGELAFIDDVPRSATTKCVKDSKVVIINQSEFEGLVKKYSHIGEVIYRNMAVTMSLRLRNADKQLKEFWSKIFEAQSPAFVKMFVI
ncbi:MAG: cyclic nucleotide-binding domain-containing protein [Planctomycetota bacterium]|nr:cyclic nucleotide-binding domain-containing protein [Planctomycetota bacterium]